MKPQLNDERQLSDLLPIGFDPHQAMRILTDYIKNIESAFDELKKSSTNEKRHLESSLRALQKDCEDQKQEIDRLTSDLLEITNTLEDHEGLLSTATQKVSNYEKQLKKMHREQSDLTNRLTQKENDANFFRQEMIKCREDSDYINSSLSISNKKLEEMESKLSVERERNLALEKESRRMTLDLQESQGKNALMERKLEEIIVKYTEEIKRLTERISTDSQHEVILLKKRVRSSLAPEIRDMEKLSIDKLSIETASNFKALLGRIVAKLEQAGFDFQQ